MNYEGVFLLASCVLSSNPFLTGLLAALTKEAGLMCSLRSHRSHIFSCLWVPNVSHAHKCIVYTCKFFLTVSLARRLNRRPQARGQGHFTTALIPMVSVWRSHNCIEEDLCNWLEVLLQFQLQTITWYKDVQIWPSCLNLISPLPSLLSLWSFQPQIFSK